MRWAVVVAGFSIAVMGSAGALAQEYDGSRKRPAAVKEAATQRIIVKLRPDSRLRIQGAESAASAEKAAADYTKRIEALASRHRLAMKHVRAVSADMHAVIVNPDIPGTSMASTLAALRSDSSVEYAVPDERRYLHAVPNDPNFSGQWFLQDAQPSATNAVAAWDITTGSEGVVIAIVDTGIRFDHPDLLRASNGGRVLAGYDFVSGDPGGGFFTSNDGNGRDSDASDPGDWVSAADVADPDKQCPEQSDSSWHGTRVAGVIGALTNNGTGVAGMTWSGWLLPVRVIGKCGGFNSDVLAGIRWAAGLPVPGVPTNQFPAKVINISLGSTGDCRQSDQDVITEVTKAGALVVVSAGNEAGVPVDSPANCAGAAGIAAVRHAGTKVGFSNIGPEIALSAPGGNCVNINPGEPCLFSIDTTSNDGATSPGNNIYTDQINFNVGTSFSAPIVAGIAGLMLSVNGNLTPAQLVSRLQSGATPFPTPDPALPMCQDPQPNVEQLECNCTTTTCGAGLANALGAVNEALRPIAAISTPETIGPGVQISLIGTGSRASCNRTIVSYEWTVIEPTTNPPALSNANTDTVSLIAPSGGEEYIIRLTVTDDQGAQDSADVRITGDKASTDAPANAGSTACLADIDVPQTSPIDPGEGGGTPRPGGGTGTGGGGGGGGGALDVLTVLLNVLAVVVALLLRPRGRSATFTRRVPPVPQSASFVQRRSRSAVSSQVFCARR